MRGNALTIGVLSMLAAIALVVVGPLAIEVLLGGGRFDAEDVRLTATVLTVFALAVPFDAMGHLVARGLYATHNTLLPVLASIAGFAVTVSVTLATVAPLGILSIPLGFVAGTAVPRRAPGDRPGLAGPARPGAGDLRLTLALEGLRGHDHQVQAVPLGVEALRPRQGR